MEGFAEGCGMVLADFFVGVQYLSAITNLNTRVCCVTLQNSHIYVFFFFFQCSTVDVQNATRFRQRSGSVSELPRPSACSPSLRRSCSAFSSACRLRTCCLSEQWVNPLEYSGNSCHSRFLFIVEETYCDRLILYSNCAMLTDCPIFCCRRTPN